MSPFDDKEVEKDVFVRLKEKTIELNSEGYIEIPAPEVTNYPVAEMSMELTQLRKRIENIHIKLDELIQKKNNEREEIILESLHNSNDLVYDTCKDFTNDQANEINSNIIIPLNSIINELNKSKIIGLLLNKINPLQGLRLVS